MLRDLVVMAANDVGDCKFTEEPDRYMAAVYKNDDPNGPMRGAARGYPDAKDKDGNPKPIKPQSSCGLFSAATLQEAGCTWAPLKKSYLHRNDIMTVLQEMGRQTGTICSPGKNDDDPFSTLLAGNILYIGKGQLAHMIVVTTDPVDDTASFDPPEDVIQVVVETVEGGGGAGNVIAKKKRILRYHPKTAVITIPGDQFNRTVNYWIDTDGLPA